MPDRAQDTEAIRAALSALADAATAGATTAYPVGSPPEFSTLMAKTNAAYSDGLAALRGLVARLEAAERALRMIGDTDCAVNLMGNCVGAVHSRRTRYDNPERVERVGCPAHFARAALGAAPGETTPT